MDSLPNVATAKGGSDSTFNENLIREVRQNSIIYDSSHPHYCNSNKKQEVWSEIAAKLNEKVEAVKTRWRTLRDRYTKERRRVSTCGVAPTFSYYLDLCFLDKFYAENRVTPAKRSKGSSSGSSNGTSGVMAAAIVKQKIAEQLSLDDCDAYPFDSNGHVFGTENEAKIKVDEARPPSSLSECLLLQNDSKAQCWSPTVVSDPVDRTEEVPSKRLKMDSSPASPSDTVVDALMRSAEALQRLAERKSIFDRSAAGPRDADECFADFVCMSLKSIENESRVHARIAILHALAQFQT
ncbi:unnamed protein product [Gongylonema pulchrum]|uniref:MADF domain-containing protein n=1 Tax=Gongylonema pulchrum TaxID=637853 RepID=A0A183CUX5_9BILA|nr:unnamed protein product [Gongylonema pulchrum]